MLVDLDIHELWYLLERCLHGSHLRSDTIERFVNEFYNNLSEHQRMNLFEWAVRLGYAWNGKNCFDPNSQCCGKDTIFMKRYHPENQYIVTMKYAEKTPRGKWKLKTETVRAFKMDGEYYVDSRRRCASEYITNIEHIDLHAQWQEHKVDGVDYDKNIIEHDGRLIFLVGPSGAGKDTVADYLVERYGYAKIPAYTTRQMRPGEQDGREHTFVQSAEVSTPEDWCREHGESCIASAQFGGCWYWTTAEQWHRAGRRLVYIIDEKGLRDCMDSASAWGRVEEGYDYAVWRIERKDNPTDAARQARDAGRITLPPETYDLTIHNDYDMDYLHSAVDAAIGAN